jgi:hypothetical protein
VEISLDAPSSPRKLQPKPDLTQGGRGAVRQALAGNEQTDGFIGLGIESSGLQNRDLVVDLPVLGPPGNKLSFAKFPSRNCFSVRWATLPEDGLYPIRIQ